MSTVTFENLGYFREYYIGNKFIGMVRCEKDREVFGYYGRQQATLSEPILLDNNRKIKAGIEVLTILYPFEGREIK